MTSAPDFGGEKARRQNLLLQCFEKRNCPRVAEAFALPLATSGLNMAKKPTGNRISTKHERAFHVRVKGKACDLEQALWPF